MSGRTDYENELMTFLGKRGYACMRSAGSHGPFDVIAWKGATSDAVTSISFGVVEASEVFIQEASESSASFIQEAPERLIQKKNGALERLIERKRGTPERVIQEAPESWGGGITRFIQVKSSVSLTQPGLVTKFRRAIQEMRTCPQPPCSTYELWFRVLRRGWRYIVIDDLPTDERALVRALQQVEWIQPQRIALEPTG